MMQQRIFPDRVLLGTAAAQAVAETIQEILKNRSEVNMVFAAAPSQEEFLAALLQQPLDWKWINAFHMDEYVGTDTFGVFLRERLFGRVPFRSVHYLDGTTPNLAAECRRYASLLETFPTDIVCLGIGENNHLAFNDPPVANFKDPADVKVVALDAACREQQVHDGCFPSLNEVPTHALTLTIPALFRGRHLFCMVPGERKAAAVYQTINARVSTRYPSTILRRHPAVQLFLDHDSAKLLTP
jgi:glucosamine-6-phosphate deaminase